MRSMTWTLRALSHLLSYPDAQLRSHLNDLVTALRQEKALSSARLREIAALARWLQRERPMEVEGSYVETFDRGRGTSLHLFEHVHGDSRDRGPAMIDLIRTYEQAGMQVRHDELPDHLPIVLEFASTQPMKQARDFLREITHLLRVIFSALQRRQSPYACVIAAALELAGEKAQAVAVPDEPSLDESWSEPAAFDGCDLSGQRSPASARTEQPVQLVRRAPPSGTSKSLGAHP